MFTVFYSIVLGMGAGEVTETVTASTGPVLWQLTDSDQYISFNIV